MPIDPSIYAQIQPPRFNSPFESLSQVLQLRAQQENMRGLKEQREAIAALRKEQTEKAQRENADSAAIDTAYAGGGEFDDVIARTPGHLRAIVAKQLNEASKFNTEAQDAKRAAEEKELKYFAHLATEVKYWEKDGPEAMQGAAQTAIAVAKKHGHDVSQFESALAQDPTKLSPMLDAIIARHRGPQAPKADYNLGNARISGETNQPIATAAPAQAALGSASDFVAKWAADRRLDPAKLSAAQTAAAVQAHARAAQAPSQAQPTQEPLVAIMGPDGQPVLVPRSQAAGKRPASSTEKASSGVQKRVLNFFNRAQQADGELEGMEAQIQAMGSADQARMEYAPNLAQSQLGQSYTAAQRAFTEARLRKDSGAAIPKEEFESDKRTYFAQPFDSKETLEQKRRARAAMLASLAFESGQALGEFLGDADEAKATVERYKTRAAGGKTADAGMVDMTAPDGRQLKVPASDVQRMLSLGAKKAGG